MEFLEEYCKQVKQRADALTNEPMPLLTEELFALYEQNGNRTEYESVYFRRREYLMTFGMASILFGKTEQIKRLEDIILSICEEECWALPAHVDRKQNSDWRITVELFASETAQALAELIAVLGDKLNKDITRRAKEEIFRRVLRPFLDAKGEYAWWEHSTLNWCAVCNGAIGSTCIYLMNEQKEDLEKVLRRICESLSYYIDGFSEDGVCLEGTSYFTYGMTYFTGFAKQLSEYSEGAIDLFQNEKVEKIARFQQSCYFSNGNTLSFSDASTTERFSMGLTSFLASRYQSVKIPELSLAAPFGYDPCFRWMSAYRDYLWTKQYYACDHVVSRSEKKGAVTIFQNAQWFLAESENGCGIAVKGGTNDEPHNHNDVGTFLYFSGKDNFLPDLGAGEYTKDYFHENRYQIFCNSSASHNVPVINETLQMAGSQYCCGRFEANTDGVVMLDLTNAYGRGSIASLIRKIRFDLKNGEVVIEDTYKISESTSSFEESLISEYKPEIEGNQFMLHGEEAVCIVSVDGTDCNVLEVDHAAHDGSHKTIYRMIWSCPLEKGKATIRVSIQKKKKEKVES